MLEMLLSAMQGMVGSVKLSPMRQRLLRMIADEPGQHGMALCRSTGSAWGTVQYHLSLLRTAGMVTAVESGSSTRFFPREMDPSRVRALALLTEGRRPDLVRYIQDNPGARQVDICDAVGVSRKTFRSAVAPLVENGLIRERRTLQNNQYFPTDELGPLVEETL